MYRERKRDSGAKGLRVELGEVPLVMILRGRAMICGVRPMLVRAAFALTAALSFAWPAQAQGDSSLSGLFSPAPMAGSFQGRFASERKLAPMFTRPGVISALSGLSMESPKSESENSTVAEASSPQQPS